MSEKISEVLVSQIRIDGGTQQRPVVSGMVEHYKELRQDGIELPPIDVVYDGANYWVWDGFHRLESAKAAKKKAIRCAVTKGTQQEAVWLSYSANKAHGMQRPQGTVKRIIEQIFCNPAYAKISLSEIARHVGASRRYVQMVRDEFLLRTEGGHDDESPVEQSESLKSDQVVTNRVCDTENAEKGCECSHPLESNSRHEKSTKRADSIEVKSSTGKTYEQKSQEKKTATTQPAMKDEDGRVIPDHLHGVFRERETFEALAQQASQLKAAVKKAAEDSPVAWGRFNENNFRSLMQQVYDLLKLSGPSIVCSYCGGVESDKCRACKGTGFLNRAQARCVPVEMRPKNGKGNK